MKEKTLIVISVVVIIAGINWVNHLKAQVAYADYSCPICGSREVLDFGMTEQGQHAQCFDCKAEFYVESNDNSHE